MNGSAASSAGRGYGDQLVGQERTDQEGDGRIHPASPADHEVDLAGDQAPVDALPVVHGQPDLHRRVRLPECSQEVRQHIDPDGRVAGHAQPSSVKPAQVVKG